MTPHFFNNPEMSRVGWALLHFLWQGTVIALALKGAWMLLEHGSSRLRHALALLSLFLMASLPVFLLCKPQNSGLDTPAAVENVRSEATAGGESTTALTTIPVSLTHGKPDFRTAFSRHVESLAPWIAAGWLLGMAVFLLKTVGGVIQVGFLKRKAAAGCRKEGTVSFHRLAARAKVAGVSVLESVLVACPTVAGWFKPVILLPKGVLEKIDRPMVDALVAHELAHIRRHDNVVNLLQTLIEDLLFFHPAVWWVSRLIRAEREACCDDDAVAVCGDALIYVRALSQAEQFRSSMPVIALNSSPLLHRIRRLTEMKIATMNHVTAFCIALLAVSFIIGTTAGSVLLATIPPQNSQSGNSSGALGEDRNSREPALEAQGTQPHKKGKYTLLCGIVGGKKDKATGKTVFFPPLQKDGTFGGAMCILLDVSTPKASRVPGELRASKLTHRVDPVYPEPAIKEHVGVRISLSINVNEEGLVTDAEVRNSQTAPPDRDSEGNWVGGVRPSVIQATNRAAIDAVKQWRYSPTLLNGKAIPVTTSAWITFTFDKDGSPKIMGPEWE